MKLKMQKDKHFVDTYFTNLIEGCVIFLNENIDKVYQGNRDGDMGSEETNEMASRLSKDDFLFEIFRWDLNLLRYGNDPSHTNYNPIYKYKWGKSGSHYWCHINNERMFIVILE